VKTKSSSATVLAEVAAQVGEHDDLALSARGLRLGERALLGQLSADADDAAGEVDIRPLEAEELSEAKAGEDGGADDERVLHRRVLDQSVDLALLEDNVQQAAGTTAVAIQSAVDAYRADLGTLNPNVAGSFGSGRREINWDGVPDAFAAPNLMPADFFNVNSPRGAVFATAGSGFQVSANAGVAPIEFDNINPTYSSLFTIFSPQRLFTALDSRKLNVQFFEPGSTTPATSSGFGAVFTDVDRRGTKIAYFDAMGRKLATFDVPISPGSATLSFLGVRFLEDRVAMVRITSGTSRLGPNEGPGRDLVVMDDFIYGEPIP
jgi:hypothetical protein